MTNTGQHSLTPALSPGRRRNAPSVWSKRWLLLISLLLGQFTSAQTPSQFSKPTSNGIPVFSRQAMPEIEFGYGPWIWTKPTMDFQKCRFWKSFTIPDNLRVVKARLRIDADDSFRLYLDGVDIGIGGTWSRVSEYDVTAVLSPGQHVLAVECYNDTSFAGLIVGMRIDLSDGRTMQVYSGKTWRIVPNDLPDWEKTTTASSAWPRAEIAAVLGKSTWPKSALGLVSKPPVLPVVLRFWQTTEFQIVVLTLCSIGALVILYLLSQLTTQFKSQRILQRERARIARDIHDDVGARLTQLVLLGERAQREALPDDKLRSHLHQMSDRTREISAAIDEVVWLVNSRHDTVQDFEAYVCNYAENFLQATPIRCRLDVATEASLAAFDLAIRRNLFLAIKEALNNAVKYSGATELFLRLQPAAHEIVVIVEDNGRGFSTADANPQRDGLKNMQQRIAEVGGTCRIDSAPGKGCRVEFRTPLVHAQKARLRWWRGDWHNRREAAARQDRAQEVAAHTVGEVSKI